MAKVETFECRDGSGSVVTVARHSRRAQFIKLGLISGVDALSPAPSLAGRKPVLRVAGPFIRSWARQDLETFQRCFSVPRLKSFD